MPVKIARSTPRPSFGLRELLVASHISRLASRDGAKSLLSTLVSESSGECRHNGIPRRSPAGEVFSFIAVKQPVQPPRFQPYPGPSGLWTYLSFRNDPKRVYQTAPPTVLQEAVFKLETPTSTTPQGTGAS